MPQIPVAWDTPGKIGQIQAGIASEIQGNWDCRQRVAVDFTAARNGRGSSCCGVVDLSGERCRPTDTGHAHLCALRSLSNSHRRDGTQLASVCRNLLRCASPKQVTAELERRWEEALRELPVPHSQWPGPGMQNRIPGPRVLSEGFCMSG